jgi:RNA polymerase sigma factor for flagellar operon FliA
MPSLPDSGTPPTRADEEDRVRRHLSLVNYAVSSVTAKVPRHVSRDDLVSAGMLGLAQAARSFDARRGVGFERYASNRIRGALLDELRSRDWATRSVRAKARKLSVAAEQLTSKLGRLPSTDEVAQAMGLAPQAIDEINDNVHRAVVLNFEAFPIDGNVEEVVMAAPGMPDDDLLERERCSYLVDAVATLPERLRRVVIGYFLEELPMQTLADELCVTESRISQMRAEALGLLRDGINSQLDPDMVDHRPEANRVTKRKIAYYAAIATNSDFHSRLDPRSASLATLAAGA